MKRQIDIETWARREHFDFFSKFEEPYHGVCVNIDCTKAYRHCKQNNISFYLYYLHQALTASQMLEPFKMRIDDGKVFIYDQINAGSTIARPNGTFGYGFFYYYASLTEFITGAKAEMERVQVNEDLTRSMDSNIIRFSALPWINFTSVSHARMFSVPDSCPRISFGKLTETDSKKMMPVSIHVTHALVDGLHVGQYIDCFQQLMDAV